MMWYSERRNCWCLLCVQQRDEVINNGGGDGSKDNEDIYIRLAGMLTLVNSANHTRQNMHETPDCDLKFPLVSYFYAEQKHRKHFFFFFFFFKATSSVNHAVNMKYIHGHQDVLC